MRCLIAGSAAFLLIVPGASAAQPSRGAISDKSDLVVEIHGCHRHCAWGPRIGQHRHVNECAPAWSGCKRIDGRLWQLWWHRY